MCSPCCLLSWSHRSQRASAGGSRGRRVLQARAALPPSAACCGLRRGTRASAPCRPSRRPSGDVGPFPSAGRLLHQLQTRPLVSKSFPVSAPHSLIAPSGLRSAPHSQCNSACALLMQHPGLPARRQADRAGHRLPVPHPRPPVQVCRGHRGVQGAAAAGCGATAVRAGWW